MKRICTLPVSFVALLAICWTGSSENIPSTSPDTTKSETAGYPLFDFKASGATEGWIVVNDNVMGGKSKGGFASGDARLIFAGSTNTDGGGFSSIRGPLPSMTDMSIADGLLIRLRKTDDREYKIDLRQKGLYKGRSISFRAELQAEKSEVWQDIRLPFKNFSASWRGQYVRGASLKPAEATELGFFIYDKKDGPFRLEVQHVTTYRDRD